jgi:AcrR family transcriptional regulator
LVSYDIVVTSSAEPRWRRLPEERPKQILDAALAVFAEHGLAGARLEDIARRAGLSKGTIYLYFPNKEELFREVIRTSVIAFIEQAEEFFASAQSPVVALEKWMEGYWTWLRSPVFPVMHRLVTSELRNFPDVAAFYAKEVVERAQRLVRGILQRGMETGDFREMDPAEAARMLSAIFVTHATWLHQKNSFKSLAHIPPDEMLAQISSFFFNAMRPDQARRASNK